MALRAAESTIINHDDSSNVTAYRYKINSGAAGIHQKVDGHSVPTSID